MLLANTGAAVTLLNWTGAGPVESVQVTAKEPFAAKSVESMKRGKVEFTQTDDGVSCSLPLDAADILIIKP